jgi:hypothetical protein
MDMNVVGKVIAERTNNALGGESAGRSRKGRLLVRRIEPRSSRWLKTSNNDLAPITDLTGRRLKHAESRRGFGLGIFCQAPFAARLTIAVGSRITLSGYPPDPAGRK